MKKNRLKILIVVLLLAVALLTAGLIHIEKNRTARDSGSAGEATEQAADGQAAADQEPDGEAAEGQETGPLATVFFTSDYQSEEGFDAPADTLAALIDEAEADGKSIDQAVICGDYTNDAVLHDYQLSPDDSIAEIREIFGSDCPDILFVQGNHDRMTEEITESGLHDCGDYQIYVLNTEEDFPWKQGKMMGCLAKVKKSSAAMEECFKELIAKGETRPVFIAGHVPLHFTARTSSRHLTGDNLYSSLIFNVVNDAAKQLDIVYLFGHNHSKGWDCYLGGSCVYRAAGDTLLLPKFDEQRVNTDEYTEETLNFTYLNAGYTGYYMNCAPGEYIGSGDTYAATDETLTATTVEVYRDRLEITRYDSDGVHDLGSDGAADPYKGGIDEGLIGPEKYSRAVPSPQQVARKAAGY